jgi:hypothetical protein
MKRCLSPRLRVNRVICFTTSLYVIHFKCALNFGEAHRFNEPGLACAEYFKQLYRLTVYRDLARFIGNCFRLAGRSEMSMSGLDKCFTQTLGERVHIVLSRRDAIALLEFHFHSSQERKETLPAFCPANQFLGPDSVVRNEVVQAIGVDFPKGLLIDQPLLKHDLTVLEEAHISLDFGPLLERGGT